MNVISDTKHVYLNEVYSIYSLDEIPMFSLDGVVHLFVVTWYAVDRLGPSFLILVGQICIL